MMNACTKRKEVVHPWISHLYHNDKLRHHERYRRPYSHSSSKPNSNVTPPHHYLHNSTFEETTILIPDGPFLRKYLKLLEEFASTYSATVRSSVDESNDDHVHYENKNHFQLIILESTIEHMEYRNSSPCVANPTEDEGDTACTLLSTASGEYHYYTESTTMNEKSRLVHLCQDYNPRYHSDAASITVLPFADLTLCQGQQQSKHDHANNRINLNQYCYQEPNEENEDEFDLLEYTGMSINNRSRCALLRAATMMTASVTTTTTTTTVSSSCLANVVILTQDEHHLSSKEDVHCNGYTVMNAQDFIHHLQTNVFYRSSIATSGSVNYSEDLLHDADIWCALLKRCEDEYLQRNQPSSTSESTVDFITNVSQREFDSFHHFEYESAQQLLQGLRQKLYWTGVLQVTKENFKEGYISVYDTVNDTTVKYFLNEVHGHFNRSIHNDTVVIEILSEHLWECPIGRKRLVHIGNEGPTTLEGNDDETTYTKKTDSRSFYQPIPTARVVGLHQCTRNRRKFVVTLAPLTSTFQRDESARLVIPMDPRIPKIRIKTRMRLDTILSQRLLVEIDGWELGSSYPYGHIVKVIGPVGDLETEISCLLTEHDIEQTPFSASALSCLPTAKGSDWVIPKPELQRRLDLRKTRTIFSVDPPGCQDIDDAMHAKVLDNGDIEIGIHIADVFS